jgi:PAS domain S-box-containing protein
MISYSPRIIKMIRVSPERDGGKVSQVFEKRIEGFQRRIDRLRAEKRTLREKIAELKRENRNAVRNLNEARRLLEALPGGVLLVQDGKIRFMNQTARRAMGCEEEETAGRDFAEFFQPEVGAKLRELHRKRISGRPVPNRYETRLITRSGNVLWCEVHVKKILLGRRRAFLFNLLDLNERKEAEKRITASEKQESVVRMSGALYHEMEKWLHSIERESPSRPVKDVPVRDRRTANPEGHRKIGEKGRTLLRELAWLGGADAEGQTVLPYDLRKVVQDVVASAKTRWGSGPAGRENGIRMKSYLRALPTLEGRPEEIRYALAALVQNAAEALDEEGNIYLTTEESEGAAYLYIQDNGRGIPPEIEDRIYDPFFTTKGKRWRGLGLSLAQAIIRKNGGDLDLKSSEGGGTTCTVRLPIPSRSSRGEAPAARIKMKDIHALVVSSQDILRDLLHLWLSGRGCQVDSTATCGEAFRLVPKKKYGLLVIDTEDVDRDNLTGLLRKARKAYPKMPAVLIENPLRPGRVKAVKGMGAHLVLAKPLHMDSVHSVFLEALRQRGPAHER